MTTPPKNRSGAKRSTAKSRSAGRTKSAASAKAAQQKKAQKEAAATEAPSPAAAPEPKPAEKSAAPGSKTPEKPAQDTSEGQADLSGGASSYSPPPQPVRTAGVARAIAWMTLGLGVVVGGAAITWPMWSPKVAQVFPGLLPADDDGAEINQLAGRIQVLEQQARTLETEKSGTLQQLEKERARFQAELKSMMARLAEVEKAVSEARDLVKAADAPASQAVATESLKALSDRLAELEKGQGDATATAAVSEASEVSSALEDMAQRLKRLEQQSDGGAAGDDAAARAIVLAVAQLREAMRLGRPFTDDLEALTALAAGRPAISQALQDLAPQADTGVPSLAVLRTRFKTLAGPIVSAADAGEGDGWIAEAVAKLSSLVSVRRIGETAPDGSVDALVSKVDVLLSAGDLRAAADALALLKGKPAEVVSPWLKAARARLAAERAIANLHVHALSLLAPAKAGG